MQKQKKSRKPKKQTTPLAQRIAVLYASWKSQGFAGLKLYVGLILACGAIIGSAVALREMEHRVLSGQVAPLPQAVDVTFANLPDWMPDDLGQQIARDLLPDGASYNDPALVADVCARAQAHPWIARVDKVTKRLTSTQRRDPSGRISRDGEVVIHAQYRRPAARVPIAAGGHVFVDDAGVRLPDDVPMFHAPVHQNGRETQRWFLAASAMPADAQPLHYIDIYGVATPPPAVGNAWDADDLTEGLKLVAKLRPYAWQNLITTIDVRNYSGQLDPLGPWLRMIANVPQGQANILFGRFPQENGDWEISPDEKLNSLDNRIVRKHNGLPKGKIDLRYADPIVWAE